MNIERLSKLLIRCDYRFFILCSLPQIIRIKGLVVAIVVEDCWARVDLSMSSVSHDGGWCLRALFARGSASTVDGCPISGKSLPLKTLENVQRIPMPPKPN